MNITVFFYNCGWVLFIPDCDMAIALYFVTTLHGCYLFLIATWISPIFIIFTTLDGCCLLLIVMWSSLFIFFYNFAWVLFLPGYGLDIPI